jgi:two-component system sensor histidine kinase/response regulator
MNQSAMKANIVVIDDDPSAYTLVHHMLLTMDKPDLTVEWVETYEQGLSALTEKQYDVYLIDYRIGGDNGVNLLRKAVELNIDAPVIILTAYGTYDVDMEVMHLGAMDYLDKKHLTPELLERSIRYALERKRNERELKQLHDRVSSLEQLKTDMIRLAAHDVKNPLATILLTVQIIQKFCAAEDWEKLPRLLDSIHDSAAKIQSITSSILSLERIEELHHDSLHDVDLSAVMTAVYKEHEPYAQQKSQVFTLQVPDEPIHILSTITLLSQAIENLIDNAIKYTPPKGHITVRAQKQGTHAVVEIEDDGYGVAEEYHTRIFQPFFRAAIQDNQEDGTGLGLHLVKSVVVRHGGEMIFRSVEGQGSTFGFWLPLTMQGEST